MATVSVIIPSYNCAKYVAEAIESVLNQTYDDFEIIVVDDGSTDNTKEILKEYIEKKRIQYIYQENQGPGAARNSGIKASKGEYIAFLDADDAFKEDNLEKKISMSSAFPQVNLIFSDYYYQLESFSKNPALEKENFLKKFSKVISKHPQGMLFTPNTFSEIFEVPFFIWTGTVMVKRLMFEKVGLFRTDLAGHEDTDMWLRLAKEGGIGYVDLPLSYYKQFRSSLTVKQPLKYAQDRINFLFPLLKQNISDKNVSYIVRKRLAWVYYDLGCYLNSENKKKEARQSFVRSILYNPLETITYKSLLFSFVPKSIRGRIKQFREIFH